MGKKNILSRNVLIVTLMLSSIILFSSKKAYAKTIYGCPGQEIIFFSAQKCPDGSVASEVKEGFINDRNNKMFLNTFSQEERDSLGIRDDNKLFIVVYKSLSSPEASFTPSEDKSGYYFERKIVELKYTCPGGMAASRKLNNSCIPLGDRPQDKQRDRDALEKEKMNIKRGMMKEINESWPKFLAEHKAEGLTEEQIKNLWDKVTLPSIYKRYNYDPKADKFLEQLKQ